MTTEDKHKQGDNSRKRVINRRKKKEKQLRINQILTAAKRIFIKKGYDNASMRHIALEAELSTGAIYVYFKGKDELFGTILISILQKEIEYYHSALESVTTTPEKLEAFFKAHINFDKDYPDDSDLLSKNLDELNLSVELRKKLDDKLMEAMSVSINIIEQGIDEGFFPETIDKQETAFLLYSSVEGLLYTTSYGHFPNLNFDSEILAKKLLNYITTGIIYNFK